MAGRRHRPAPLGWPLVGNMASMTLQLLMLMLQSVVWAVEEDVEGEVKGAKTCTKAVPVSGAGKKKVSVLRRVPANCSNWDKAWAWITSKDCGTKYRLDQVEVSSPQVITYRVVKVCCPDDHHCLQAQDGGDFLGTMAWIIAVVVVALVIVIVLISWCSYRCRKTTPSKRTSEPDTRDLNFTTYEENESALQTPNDNEEEDEEDRRQQQKTSQSDLYAEIHAEATSVPPRYDDIFSDHPHPYPYPEVNPDPILQPSAPPIWLYEARADDDAIPLVTNQKKAAPPQGHETCGGNEVAEDGLAGAGEVGGIAPPPSSQGEEEELRPLLNQPHDSHRENCTKSCNGVHHSGDSDGDSKATPPVPPQRDSCVVYYNHAVQSVTRDAPVVLSGISSSRSPPLPPPRERENRADCLDHHHQHQHQHHQQCNISEERGCSEGCARQRDSQGGGGSSGGGGSGSSNVGSGIGSSGCGSSSSGSVACGTNPTTTTTTTTTPACECDGSGQYETLTDRLSKDCHDYQQLCSRSAGSLVVREEEGDAHHSHSGAGGHHPRSTD